MMTPMCTPYLTHIYVLRHLCAGLGHGMLREEDLGVFPNNVYQELPARSLQTAQEIGS